MVGSDARTAPRSPEPFPGTWASRAPTEGAAAPGRAVPAEPQSPSGVRAGGTPTVPGLSPAELGVPCLGRAEATTCSAVLGLQEPAPVSVPVGTSGGT